MDRLAFNLDLYFSLLPGALEIDLSLLRPRRCRKDDTKRAWEFMSRAARGEHAKRDPISVVRADKRKFVILDGNCTFAVARASHWPRILALEFASEEEFLEWKRS